ncbi:unnamed protein product [Ectocarpus sp. CCAP 1310/34]|nr:unnamed protein product [Ectocarpus sp. CCAP 1310/34]
MPATTLPSGCARSYYWEQDNKGGGNVARTLGHCGLKIVEDLCAMPDEEPTIIPYYDA